MGQIKLVDDVLEQSLVTLATKPTFVRLKQEIDRLRQTQEFDVAWLGQVKDLLTFILKVEDGFGLAKAALLRLLRDHWDDLPLNIRRDHGFVFMEFAQRFTGKQRSTIENYITVAGVWVEQGLQPPNNVVEISVRDLEGRPILEDNKVLRKEVVFDPFIISMTKLLYAAARASAGEMTPLLWEMLVDEFYSCTDLQLALAGSPTTKDKDFQIYYEVLGPGLFVTQNGETFCLAEINWAQYEDTPIVKKALDRLFKYLGVVLDEDRIFELNKKALDASNKTQGIRKDS